MGEQEKGVDIGALSQNGYGLLKWIIDNPFQKMIQIH